MSKNKETAMQKTTEDMLSGELAQYQTERGQLTVAELVNAGFNVELTRVMKQGDNIHGYYVGPGKEITMRETGTVLTTHKIELAAGGVMLTIIGCHALDQKLPTYQIGTEVVLRHQGQLEHKGRRINDILVMQGPVNRDVQRKYLPADVIAERDRDLINA